ncbi:MAG TPA: PHB depolymerase family esterase [Balneolaceae bacterium]
MSKVLISSKAPFKIDTPYRLIETGEPGEKPLIVYLHGFNQTIEEFQERTEKLLGLKAYHLFVQAPYPVYSRRNRVKKVEEWGRAWYWYDGEQAQFVKSLELASQFVHDVMESVLQQISVNRIAIFGYSMGGYLAGYFGLSRPEQLSELIVIGGRIKTEVFEEKSNNVEHLNVLALHGKKDESVKSSPQKESCEKLSQWNASVTFKELNAGHDLDELYINEAKRWLAEMWDE